MKCPLFRKLLYGKKNTKPAVKITNTIKHSPAAKSNTSKEVLESGGPDPIGRGAEHSIHNSDVAVGDGNLAFLDPPLFNKHINNAVRGESGFQTAMRKIFYDKLLHTINEGISKDESREQIRDRITEVYIQNWNPTKATKEIIADFENDKIGNIRPERREEYNRIYDYISNLLEESKRVASLLKDQGTDAPPSPTLDALIAKLKPAVAYLTENPNICAGDSEKFLNKFNLR